MSTRTVSKTIDLSSFPNEAVSKYITKITNTGITIHPEVYNGSSATERSSYIQLDGNGMELFNSSGISIAKYSEDIRLGNENEGKLLITAGGQGHTHEDAGTYIIDGNESVLAQFLVSGVQIGQSGGAHSVVDAKGQKFFADDGQTLLARFGNSSENGKTNIREVQAVKSNSLLYNMGYSIDANESMSVTTNTGASLSFTITQSGSVLVDSSATDYSYLVFIYFTQDTIYDYSLSSNDSTYHANGAFSANGGIAYGLNSHAINEGTACGYNSHAQGRGTVALGTNQCVIGRYNSTAPYTTTGTSISRLFHPFVIGNGSDDNSRSNALTVDWDGVVNCKDVVASNLVGEIKQYAGATVPTGWLECDGSEVAVADYPLLYAAIGDLWGTPSDSDHFVLPDFRGKVAVGHDNSNMSPDADFDTVGKSGGDKTHAHTTGNFTLQTTHMPAHTHTTSTANEYYITSSKSTANNTRVAYSSSGNRLVDGQNDTSTSSFHHRWETASVGGGSAHNHGNTGDSSNVQPYAVVNYIICAI